MNLNDEREIIFTLSGSLVNSAECDKDQQNLISLTTEPQSSK